MRPSARPVEDVQVERVALAGRFAPGLHRQGVRAVPRIDSPLTFIQAPMPSRMATSLGSNLPLPMGPMLSRTLPPRAAALASSVDEVRGRLVRVVLLVPAVRLVGGRDALPVAVVRAGTRPACRWWTGSRRSWPAGPWATGWQMRPLTTMLGFASRTALRMRRFSSGGSLSGVSNQRMSGSYLAISSWSCGIDLAVDVVADAVDQLGRLLHQRAPPNSACRRPGCS